MLPQALTNLLRGVVHWCAKKIQTICHNPLAESLASVVAVLHPITLFVVVVHASDQINKCERQGQRPA